MLLQPLKETHRDSSLKEKYMVSKCVLQLYGIV